MRPGQQNNKRMRGRNRGGKGPNPLTRSYESNGPDVKIRGTALHIAEKYVQLARDAQSSGDRVGAENYLQHAEHYYRLVAAAQAQMPQPQPVFRSDDDSADDEDDRMGLGGNGGGYGDRPQQRQGGQPYYGSSEQPYVNGMNGDGNGGGQTQPEDDAGGSSEDARFDPRPNPVQAQQPSFSEGQGGEGQGGGQPANGGGGQGQNFRSRRRRPYRERFSGEGGQDNQPRASQPPSEAAQGDE